MIISLLALNILYTVLAQEQSRASVNKTTEGDAEILSVLVVSGRLCRRFESRVQAPGCVFSEIMVIENSKPDDNI